MMEYWKVSLDELFSDYGLEISPELIEDIITIRDMESEACGFVNIPNPKSSEIEDLMRKIKQLEDGYEKQLLGIKKGVAQRRGVDITDISIDSDGHVTYDLW